MPPCGYVGSLPTLPRSMGSSNMIISHHSCIILFFRTPSHDYHLSFLYHFLRYWLHVKKKKKKKKKIEQLVYSVP